MSGPQSNRFSAGAIDVSTVTLKRDAEMKGPGESRSLFPRLAGCALRNCSTNCTIAQSFGFRVTGLPGD